MSRIETNHLIIGNSTAAIAAVEGIRSLDSIARITLLAAETEHTYSRPLITYLLGGEVGEDRMYYRPQDFYEKLKVHKHLGAEVVRVEPGKHFVRTSQGEIIHYEKLLIATGGVPIIPDIPGNRCEGLFTFLRWQDAVSVRTFIEKRKATRAVIIGAGLIGMKTLEALLSLGIHVDVVELAEHALSAMLDETAAQMIHDKLRDDGVQIHTQKTVKNILSRYDTIQAVQLTDGTEIPCDLLILAIGVRPNIGFLEGSGIQTDRGVLVDDAMRTSHADIFAAGDVAQGYDLLTGVKRPVAIFPSAFGQGKTAGLNMAGGSAEYKGSMAMNSVGFRGIHSISVGYIQPPDDSCEVLSRLDRKRGVYKKVILKENRIIGAMFVNDVDRAGIYTGLIRAGLDISGIKDLLLTEEFGLLMLPQTYRKHLVSGAGIEV